MSKIDDSLPDLGILVLSCDKYDDLWGPYFASFFEQWGDCPFPVYLASNEKVFAHPRVKTLCSGPDVDWSSSIKKVLTQMGHKYVITFIEDAFFMDPIDTAVILDLVRWADGQGAQCLSLRGVPAPQEATGHPMVGRVRENTLYRTALHGAVWNLAFLNGLLVSGETAWHYEINSPRRARKEPRLFSARQDLIPALHGVEKGKWFPDALRRLQNRGYVGTSVARPILDAAELSRNRRSEKLKGVVKACLPPRLRGWVHRVYWNYMK